MRMIAVLVVVGLVGAPRVARACSKRHQSVFELFELATTVAVVKVTSMPASGAGTVGLESRRVLKGRKPTTAKETDSSCRAGFRVGRTALVFLGKDRWPVGLYEGYQARPGAPLVGLLQRWARATDDAARVAILVETATGADEALRFDAAHYLADRPALIAALTPVQTEALVAALAAPRFRDAILAVLARQHRDAWRAQIVAGTVPVGLRFSALRAHDYEAITDPNALADLMDAHPGEYAPERIAAFERCERVHGRSLEPFSSYGDGAAEHWWARLATACRTGVAPTR